MSALLIQSVYDTVFGNLLLHLPYSTLGWAPRGRCLSGVTGTSTNISVPLRISIHHTPSLLGLFLACFRLVHMKLMTLPPGPRQPFINDP